jgi:hypothetical protein
LRNTLVIHRRRPCRAFVPACTTAGKGPDAQGLAPGKCAPPLGKMALSTVLGRLYYYDYVFIKKDKKKTGGQLWCRNHPRVMRRRVVPCGTWMGWGQHSRHGRHRRCRHPSGRINACQKPEVNTPRLWKTCGGSVEEVWADLGRCRHHGCDAPQRLAFAPVWR